MDEQKHLENREIRRTRESQPGVYKDEAPSAMAAADIWRHAEDAFEEILAHQRIKLLRLARRIHPGVTPEDLRNVHDFPDIHGDPAYNFEDGILSGLIAARVSLKRRVFQPLMDGEPVESALTPEEVAANMGEKEA